MSAPSPSSAQAAPAAQPAQASASAAAASSSQQSQSKPRYTAETLPDDADPLDHIDFERLRADGAKLPKTPQAIEAFLNEMPLTAEVMPSSKAEMNTEFCGIQEIIDETPQDTRAENFKDSGNEAYKLALAMRKEWKEATDKRAKSEAERKARGETEQPKRSAEEQKAEELEVKHLAKLQESSRKRLLDALAYYQQALDVESESKNTKTPITLSAHLKSQILCNRAQVHLTMENYGRAQADCDAVLQLIPKHAKAAYRGATAALAVHPPKIAKARQFIDAAKQHDPERAKKDFFFRAEQKSLADVEKRIEALEAAERAKEEARLAAQRERDSADTLYQQHLQKALQSRGIKLGPLVFDFARSAYAEQSAEGPGHLPRPLLRPPPPAPYSSSTTLAWPLLFLYPESLQSDFIQSVDEDASLETALAQMFPPSGSWAPWDSQRRYHLDNLSVWIDTRGPNVPHDSTPQQDAAARSLVNPRHSLRDILSNPKLAKKGFVVPGVPTFIILPKH